MSFVPKILEPPPPRAADPMHMPNTRLALGTREPSRVFGQPWSGWFRKLQQTINANSAALSSGLTTTIVTAKLTPGGVTGSMTFTNGVLTAQTPAT